MYLGCVHTTVFPPFVIGHLGGVPKKVRVIGIPDCLDSGGIDISKDDCSSKYAGVVRRDRPCRSYSKAVLVWLKTEESRLLPSARCINPKIAPFIGVSLAIVCEGREFNVIKFKGCN